MVSAQTSEGLWRWEGSGGVIKELEPVHWRCRLLPF